MPSCFLVSPRRVHTGRLSLLLCGAENPEGRLLSWFCSEPHVVSLFSPECPAEGITQPSLCAHHARWGVCPRPGVHPRKRGRVTERQFCTHLGGRDARFPYLPNQRMVIKLQKMSVLHFTCPPFPRTFRKTAVCAWFKEAPAVGLHPVTLAPWPWGQSSAGHAIVLFSSLSLSDSS